MDASGALLHVVEERGDCYARLTTMKMVLDYRFWRAEEEMSKNCRIPRQCAIDYSAILSAAPTSGVANTLLFLQESLPSLWRDAYLKTTPHQPNLARLCYGSFEYICDIYSDLEAKGEVAYDQTVQDRVVAAFGISGGTGPVNARRSPRWINPDENLAVTERDHGHLIANCMGGSGLDLNVFSQDRRLNRGRSEQGRVYRQMERYCSQHSGTFCFSRPIYVDSTCVPRWIEFGVLRDDQTMWVKRFDN